MSGRGSLSPSTPLPMPRLWGCPTSRASMMGVSRGPPPGGPLHTEGGIDGEKGLPCVTPQTLRSGPRCPSFRPHSPRQLPGEEEE